MLTAPFTLSELQAAVSSRKSPASGLDNISPLLIQNLLCESYQVLLDILNSIWLKRIIPPSWRNFCVIPIPNNNSNSSFRPIAISSALCEIVEHIIKNRLDWWLEYNNLPPNNIFGFRRGLGTI